MLLCQYSVVGGGGGGGGGGGRMVKVRKIPFGVKDLQLPLFNLSADLKGETKD
jgi:hypothetical protein